MLGSIVAGNTGSGPDIYGNVAGNSAYDLVGNGNGMSGISNGDLNHNQVGASSNPINPLLAPLGNYGGPTQTMALLPGSPAIDAGSNAPAVDANGNPLTTDQRGLPRTVNGTVDIGAVESQGYTLTPVSGSTPQTALAGSALANPLAVTVTPNNANDPVDGGVVTFTAPASAASAALSAASATIAGGSASETATANGLRGAYTVTASASGAASAGFSLTNELQPAFAGLTSAAITYGTSTITFTGTLAAGSTAATGSVTVTISGNGITTLTQSPSLDSSGNFSATFSITSLPANPGSPYTMTYAYAAQDFFLAASDNSTTLTINARPITVTADAKSKVFGAVDPALTYQITGGSLAFQDAFSGTLSRATGENVGSYAIYQNTLTAGSNYNLTYVGANLTISQASTSTVVVSSVNPSVFGQNVTFTATVNVTAPGSTTVASPTGTVTFYDSGTAIGTGTLVVSAGNDQATYTTSALGTASHTITAAYTSGDGNFNASPASSSITQVVGMANTATSVATSGTPSVSGQSVTFTATVTVASPGSTAVAYPTGTVTFYDGGTQIGTGTLAVVNGLDQASYTTSALATGQPHDHRRLHQRRRQFQCQPGLLIHHPGSYSVIYSQVRLRDGNIPSPVGLHPGDRGNEIQHRFEVRLEERDNQQPGPGNWV